MKDVLTLTNVMFQTEYLKRESFLFMESNSILYLHVQCIKKTMKEKYREKHGAHLTL